MIIELENKIENIINDFLSKHPDEGINMSIEIEVYDGYIENIKAEIEVCNGNIKKIQIVS